MSSQLLSKYERDYVIEGVNVDLREDGRSCRDYRRFSVQSGVVSNTSGSARVQLVSCAQSPTLQHILMLVYRSTRAQWWE